MNDNEMKVAREQFFEGHGPMSNHNNNNKNGSRKVKSSNNGAMLSGDDMLNRIDPRLRRLLIRSCRNSYAAGKVVELFESFILYSFSNVPSAAVVLQDDWWMDLLLECPTLTHRNDNHHRSTVQFFFHPTLPTGGFHRLLLHAVCQFHGLNVASRTEDSYECIWSNGVTTNGARVLNATGYTREEESTSMSNSVLLLQHIGENVDDSVGYTTSSSRNINIEERMVGLRI